MNNTHLALLTVFLLFLLGKRAHSQDFLTIKAEYGVEEGLPVKWVDKITEDREGFIWLLAEEGLVKFDGYDFKLFPFIEYGFRKKRYSSILVDKQNNIWLSTNEDSKLLNVAERTEKTVDIFNPESEMVYPILNYLEDTIFSDFRIKEIYALDSLHIGITLADGRVWSYSNQINLIYENTANRNFNYYFVTPDGDQWLIDDWKVSLVNEKEEIVEQEKFRSKIQQVSVWPFKPGLLIQTNEGRDYSNLWVKIKGEPRHSRVDINKSPIDLRKYKRIAISKDGIIALADDSMISFYKEELGCLQTVFIENADDENTFPFEMFYHSGGSLWYRYKDYHLGLLRTKKKYFKNYLNENRGFNVKGITSLNDSLLCVNTNVGTYLLDIYTGVAYPPFDTMTYFKGYGILKDGMVLYSGVDDRGIKKIDLDSHSQRFIPYPGELGTCDLKTYFPYIDRLNRFWWGTSCGLILFNRYTEKMELRPINYYEATEVYSIAELDKEIFVGTSKGLFSCGEDCDTFIRITAIPALEIYEIFIDKNENFWLGTKNAGLIRWKKGWKSAQSYSVVEGLKGNTIFNVEEDRDGHLWISTQNGLYCLNVKEDRVSVFFESDGLTHNKFNYLSAYHHTDGSIFFGGIRGLNRIIPAEIRQSMKQPPVNLKLSEIEKLDFQTGLYKRIPQNQKNEVKLLSNERVIRISYSGLDFPNSRRTSFMYRIGGTNSDWLSTTENKVYYQNIPFGRSSIYIKAQRQSEESALAISIFRKTPFYRTWIFGFLMILLSLGGAFAILRWRTWKIEKDKLFLMGEVEKKTAEIAKDKQIILHQNNQLKEINRLKDRIFQIVGHEFRDTINSYEELSTTINFWMKRGDYQKITEIADYMEQSSSHLSFLVDNLISWGRIDGQIPHQPQVVSLSRVVKRIESSIGIQLSKKNIDFCVTSSIDCLVYADPSMIHIALRNVLNNAIKYSNYGGKIELKVLDCDKYIKIEIKDNGIGIEEDRLKLLMKESMESMVGTNGEKGMGIGLLLCKRLAELDNGSIHIDSKLGEGTSVKLAYPQAD